MLSPHPMTHADWQPLFSGSQSTQIIDILQQLAQSLTEPPSAWIPQPGRTVEPYRIARGATLSTGSPGIALFYAYLLQYSPDLVPHDDLVNHLIAYACDAIETATLPNGL